MKILKILVANLSANGFESNWAIHEPQIGNFGRISTEFLNENTIEIWQIRAPKGGKIRIRFDFMNIALTR
jgi:hypothetical protein